MIDEVRPRGKWLPFTVYHVQDHWITTMLWSKKITFDTACFLYAQSMARAEDNLWHLHVVERAYLDVEAAREKEPSEAEILKKELKFRSIRRRRFGSCRLFQ